MVIWPFYLANFEQVFAHRENDLYEEKCVPSSISAENIFDQFEN